MSQIRDTYEALLERWKEDWMAQGKPLESAYPALKTFIASGNPYSEITLLRGKIPNLKTVIERSAGLGSEQRPTGAMREPTIIEIACGLTGANSSEVLMAKVAAYGSKLSHEEALAVGISLYFSAFHGSGDEDFPVSTPSIQNFEHILAFTENLIGPNSLLFLVPFVVSSMDGQEVSHGKFGLQVLSCHVFWAEFSEWYREKKIRTRSRLLDPELLEEIEEAWSYEDIAEAVISENEGDYLQAQSMVQIYVWLDQSKFARKVTMKEQNKLKVRHRKTSQESPGNVVKLKGNSSEHRCNQINDANLRMEQAGISIEKPSLRNNVLQLQSRLKLELGDEGCKRFAELSHLAFMDEFQNTECENYKRMAMFWANFRTFLDLEKATSIGHPFDIEHFSEPYFIINDSKGARIKNKNGAGFDLTAVTQQSREVRDNL